MARLARSNRLGQKHTSKAGLEVSAIGNICCNTPNVHCYQCCSPSSSPVSQLATASRLQSIDWTCRTLGRRFQPCASNISLLWRIGPFVNLCTGIRPCWEDLQMQIAFYAASTLSNLMLLSRTRSATGLLYSLIRLMSRTQCLACTGSYYVAASAHVVDVLLIWISQHLLNL